MLNSAPGVLVKHIRKGNKKTKLNITFYIFNILNAQVPKKYFYI
jgi:hypothetical protein